MRPNLEIQQRHDPGGDWRPPRPKGSNHISRVGDWLLHGGQSITRMDDTPSAIGLLPDNMQEFRTFSMYFSDGSFYIVPYDATVHSVGNGSQKEEDEEGERRPSGWSDGDQSEAQEYADWSPLSFSVLGNDQTSFATIGGQTTRLHVQHPSQDPWVNELLPDRYHSLNLTREPNRGGIVGFFPILIGLVAFSVEPDQVTTALSHCISGDKWRLHGQRRGAGRKSARIRPCRNACSRSLAGTDRRGLVIETYTYTPDARSTPAELRAFENGQCGSKPYS